MKSSLLLQWQYLIFLLPFGLSALLLLLSSLRIGHHGGHGGHSAGHGIGHGSAVGTHSSVPSHTAGHHASHAAPQIRAGGTAARQGNSSTTPNAGPMHVHGMGGQLKLHLNATPRHASGTHRHGTAHDRAGANSPLASLWQLLLRLTGIGRAPLVMILEVFFLVWGFSGYVAVQALAHDALPSTSRVWTAAGVALIGGVIGARIAAEVIARVLPPEESLVVSREELFGLTGRVTFTVSEAEGRIRIYDQFGTLHDEPCRVAPGHPAIEKGRSALVMDRDVQGRLLIEPIPDVVS